MSLLVEHLSGQGREELGGTASSVDEGVTEPVDRDEIGVDLNENVVRVIENGGVEESDNVVAGNEIAVHESEIAIEGNEKQRRAITLRNFGAGKIEILEDKLLHSKTNSKTCKRRMAGWLIFCSW